MNEDLNNKIKQITDILGQENIPDNVKGLLSLLASPGQDEESTRDPDQAHEGAPRKTGQSNNDGEKKLSGDELERNLKMIKTVKLIMDKLGSNSDPRISLLSALKPFMGDERQEKIENCINILQISSLARLVGEDGKGIF